MAVTDENKKVISYEPNKHGFSNYHEKRVFAQGRIRTSPLTICHWTNIPSKRFS